MIDLEHLERQTAGDTALQQELLALFLTQIEHVSSLIGAPDSIDSMELAEVVHRLRGAAMAVGAPSLAASLLHSETLLGTPNSSADVVDGLRLALQDAHSQVSRLLPR